MSQPGVCIIEVKRTVPGTVRTVRWDQGQYKYNNIGSCEDEVMILNLFT